MSKGKYCGIAPDCNIVSIKILNNAGKGSSADVLAGIQWMIDNAERYNIRAANLSIGTSNTSSSDPLVRAVEAAWDRGITVTIAAGNNGPGKGTVTSPGISRKVITVGASDDNNIKWCSLICRTFVKASHKQVSFYNINKSIFINHSDT